MGCSQPQPAEDPTIPHPTNHTSTLTKTYSTSTTQEFLITMIGNTAVSGTVLGFNASGFKPVACQTPIPRYCNALIHDNSIGYITGGIEDLSGNGSMKGTTDLQILEGVISKKFILVNMGKITTAPSSSLELQSEMINARYAHCAIEMAGHFYVLGGRQYGGDEHGLLSACEKFDFGIKEWKAIPSLQYPRAAASVVAYGGHIYIFGGYSGNNTRTKVIESYADGDASWLKVPFALHEGLQGALVLKKPGSECSILIFGGKTNFQKSNRVVQLNLDKQTVRHCSGMKQLRSFHKGTAIGNQIYLIGGGSEYLQVYDFVTQESRMEKEISYLEFCSMKELNSFSQFQDQIHLTYKKRVIQPSAFSNQVHLFGHSHEPFSKTINTDNFVVISEGQSLHHHFFQFSNVARINKEHSFVMGGISPDFGEVTNLVYSFSMKTQELKYLQPMLTARYAFASAVLGSYLYVVGGRTLGDDDLAILNQCERFSFESYEWEQIVPLKHKRQSATVVAISTYIMAFGGYKGNGVRSNEIEVFIQPERRWVQLDMKFELAVESMTAVTYANTYYLFGGRAEQSDIQKIFKLTLQIDEGLKYEKFINVELEPVGSLSHPGTNLKVSVNSEGIAYVFGNIPHGIDVYDLKKQKVIETQQLAVFEKLADQLFQSYILIY